MKQTQRHDAIIELVKKQGYVSTEELVEHFSVSPQTIRRDLNDLADQNMILRHHGGAAPPAGSCCSPTPLDNAFRPPGKIISAFKTGHPPSTPPQPRLL